MKRIYSGIIAVALLCLVPGISQAETRHLVDTPDGQKSCLWQNGGYTDCINPADVRHEVDTPDGKMVCLWQNGSYTDCKPVQNAAANAAADSVADLAAENAAALAAVENAVAQSENAETPAAAAETPNVAAETPAAAAETPAASVESKPAATKTVRALPANRISVYKNQNAQTQTVQNDALIEQNNVQMEQTNDQSYQNDVQSEQNNVQYEENDDNTSSDSFYNPGLEHGVTYSVGIGWYGHVLSGENWENGLALTADIGYKWSFIGISLDMDVSMSPENNNVNLWTFSFTPMFKGYIPLSENFLQTIGVGVGVTAWSRDRDYVDRDVVYDPFGGGYDVYETRHTETFGSDGNLSFKLQFRLDWILDDFMIGMELNWIPQVNVSDGHGIVDNLVGIVLRFGGI